MFVYMPTKYILATLIFISFSALSQTITPSQKKALNNYAYSASQSASEVNTVVKSLQYYYLTFYRVEYVVPRFTCPVQQNEDYFALALKESSSLPSTLSPSLNDKLKALQSDISKIHLACQALDTYHKLKDYERDDLAKADKIISELQFLTKSFRTKQADLSAALTSAYGKMNVASNTPYRKADELMREAISNESNFLDLWTVNLNEKVHTGWPFDQLKESISRTESSVAKLKSASASFGPAAMQMYASFQEGLDDVLKLKQHALDNYNPAARMSDKHSNDVYFDLMNNINGALISDYNQFGEAGSTSGYLGIYAVQYASVFEVRKTAAVLNLSVKPFTDTPHAPITIAKQKTALTKSAFLSLNQYVSFIYSNFTSIEILCQKMESFSSTVARYKGYKSFARLDQLNYGVDNFKVPLTEYTQTIAGSSALPPSISKSLNAQATVLRDILKELEQIIITINNETATRNYEKDNLDGITALLEREKDLILIWDERKEQLYDDVRMVFDAYPPAAPQSPWFKSGQALQRLADANRTALFEAKALYKINDVSKGVATANIDSLVRQAITDMYANMKGIQRLGGTNGNDPYTPYEKLPQISSVFSEKLAAIKPANVRPPGFNHPYNEQVHLYNVGVNALNKFSELSKTVFILQMPIQPPVFKMEYPEKVVAKTPVSNETTQGNQQATQSVPVEEQPVTPTITPPVNTGPEVLRLRDTIVIERHDTIYIRETDANLRSMEGYAINNLVLLIDVSGSMNTADKLPLLKESLVSLLPMMRPEDKVAIVAYSEKAKVMLQPTSFRDENKVKNVIARLTSSGKTNGNAGLKMAYKVADENYIRGGNNRIILATDGEFPMSDELRKFIADNAQQDILLSVFNFGARDKIRLNLKELSDLGRGHFADIKKESAELDLIREVKSKKTN